MSKNIFVTSLVEPPSVKSFMYYSFQENGIKRYCDAILNTEACAKYVLSEYHIDQIFVIGPPDPSDEGNELMTRKLSACLEGENKSLDEMSSYELFRYRIAQYIADSKIDTDDRLNALDKDEQDSIKKVLDDFFDTWHQETGLKKKLRFFHDLDADPSGYSKLLSAVRSSSSHSGKDSLRELNWAQLYLYDTMSDQHKLCVREDNEDLNTTFAPVDDDPSDIRDILAFLRSIVGHRDEDIHLYLDMTGGNKTDNFTMMCLLTILASQKESRVTIEKVFSTQSTGSGISRRIHDDTIGYNISNLLAGMNSFIQYGKVNTVIDFFSKSGTPDSRTDALLYAMNLVDEGVSLCDITSLFKGITLLKNIFNDPVEKEFINPITMIVERSIRQDYGKLLQGDDIDIIELVKWAYRKDFYQQTLTIIESCIPADFVKKGIFYYARSEEEREKAIQELNKAYYNRKPYERWQVSNDISHYFFKYNGINNYKKGQTPTENMWNYACYRISKLGMETDGEMTSYTACPDTNALRDLFFAYSNIGTIRNKTNHAQERDDKWIISYKNSEHSQRYQEITEAIDYFFACYEKVISLMEDVKFESLTIPAEEFLQYAKANRPEPEDK